jgi:hypothetical protein
MLPQKLLFEVHLFMITQGYITTRVMKNTNAKAAKAAFFTRGSSRLLASLDTCSSGVETFRIPNIRRPAWDSEIAMQGFKLLTMFSVQPC